ncbi:unnamed protein product [Hyaloperonospora brassicae]|uniref:DM2 domain-containing protein n=1 Tax=Hyaloperonospora brassicae TaxID=162125 RepID=A0AAV0T4Y2_HYABA|nr:unnamed protein product [Hyaloperonospora brassicae]
MDAVHRLLDYLETFPSDAGAVELRDQLSAFTHYDLRAACSRLNLAMSKRQNKKGGYISALVSYWMARPPTPTPTPPPPVAAGSGAEVTPVPSRATSEEPTGMELPADVAQFVQLFPPHGHVQELTDQLAACRSRTLRSACVVLDLHPRKSFTKADFLGLLVSYWQDSSAVTPRAAAHEKDVDDMARPAPVPPSTTKRARDDEGKKVGGKKQKQKQQQQQQQPKKSVKDVALRGDDDPPDKWTAALEKAKVVKEWASAIEILSRVDGSAESIESIRSLIDSVVHSATSEL